MDSKHQRERRSSCQPSSSRSPIFGDETENPTSHKRTFAQSRIGYSRSRRSTSADSSSVESMKMGQNTKWTGSGMNQDYSFVSGVRKVPPQSMAVPHSSVPSRNPRRLHGLIPFPDCSPRPFHCSRRFSLYTSFPTTHRRRFLSSRNKFLVSPRVEGERSGFPHYRERSMSQEKPRNVYPFESTSGYPLTAKLKFQHLPFGGSIMSSSGGHDIKRAQSLETPSNVELNSDQLGEQRAAAGKDWFRFSKTVFATRKRLSLKSLSSLLDSSQEQPSSTSTASISQEGQSSSSPIQSFKRLVSAVIRKIFRRSPKTSSSSATSEPQSATSEQTFINEDIEGESPESIPTYSKRDYRFPQILAEKEKAESPVSPTIPLLFPAQALLYKAITENSDKIPDVSLPKPLAENYIKEVPPLLLVQQAGYRTVND